MDDILEGLRLQSSVFCRMALSSDLGFAKEALDGAPFYLILSGRAWLQIGEGDPLHLDQGDIVILLGGEKHCLLSTPDADRVPFRHVAENMGFPVWTPGMRYKTIELKLGSGTPSATLISGVYAFEYPRRNPLLSALPPVLLLRANTDSPTAGILASIAALLNEELLSGTPGSESVCARLSDIMFIQVVRHHLAAAETLPRGWLRGMVDAEIAPALAAMHRAPERPWSVGTLAREVGMSRSRFAARFHDVVGQAPLEYLTHWRMYQAAGRLAEGPIALPALAASAGYRSEVSFAKAFKRWAGRSPAEYRRWLTSSGYNKSTQSTQTPNLMK